MSEPVRKPSRRDPQDRRIRRSWRLLVASFVLLCGVAATRLVAGAQPADMLLAALVVVVGAAAVRYQASVATLETGRRAEAESFARILQGLSRSVSPDAIVEAIVQEVAVATAADHVVVVRRRPGARILEATLVSSRPGVPSSTTILPIGDLEDPPDAGVVGERAPVAVPIAVPVAVGSVAPAEPGSMRRSAAEPIVRLARDLVVRAGALDAAPRETGGVERRGRRAPASLVAERIAARVRAVYGLTHTLSAPLRGDDELVGAIVVSRRTADPWPASAQRILSGAAVEASAALSRAYSHREAETRASTDALTGLPNRRYFDEFCGLLARRRRAEDAVGVLMIDIDHFKRVNDTRGHATGDEVLRAVAGAIAAAVREDDVPARFGGEEFAVLLRNPSPEVAFGVGERVRRAVAALDLNRLGVGAVSVSVGVAVASLPDEPVASLVAHADRALYEAKRTGRDRVVAVA